MQWTLFFDILLIKKHKNYFTCEVTGEYMAAGLKNTGDTIAGELRKTFPGVSGSASVSEGYGDTSSTLIVIGCRLEDGLPVIKTIIIDFCLFLHEFLL